MVVYLLNDDVPSVIQRFCLLLHFTSFFFVNTRIGSEIFAKLRKTVDVSLKFYRLIKENLQRIAKWMLGKFIYYDKRKIFVYLEVIFLCADGF